MDNLNEFLAVVDRFATFGWVKPALRTNLDQSLSTVSPNDFDADSIAWINEAVAHLNALQPVLSSITAINSRAFGLT